MRLISLETLNFRGLPDGVPVRFDGGNFTIVYGPNEAGKSSLLEAITLALFGRMSKGELPFQRWTSLERPVIKLILCDADDREFTITRNYQDGTSRLTGSGVELGQDARVNERIRLWWNLQPNTLFRDLLVVGHKEMEFGDGQALGEQIERLAAGAGQGYTVADIIQSIDGRLALRAKRLFKASDGAHYDRLQSEHDRLIQESATVMQRLAEYGAAQGELVTLREQVHSLKEQLTQLEKAKKWLEAWAAGQRTEAVVEKAKHLESRLEVLGLELQGLAHQVESDESELGRAREWAQVEALRRSQAQAQGTYEKARKLAEQWAAVDAELAGSQPISDDDAALVERAYEAIAHLQRSLELQGIDLTVQPRRALLVRVAGEAHQWSKTERISLTGVDNPIVIEDVVAIGIHNRGAVSIASRLQVVRSELTARLEQLGVEDGAELRSRHALCRRREQLSQELALVRGDCSLAELAAVAEKTASEWDHWQQKFAGDLPPQLSATELEAKLSRQRLSYQDKASQERKLAVDLARQLGDHTLSDWEMKAAEARLRLLTVGGGQMTQRPEILGALSEESTSPEEQLSLLDTRISGVARDLQAAQTQCAVLQERLQHFPDHDHLIDLLEKKAVLERQLDRAQNHHRALLYMREGLLAAFDQVKQQLAQSIEEGLSQSFERLTAGRHARVALDLGKTMHFSIQDKQGMWRALVERSLSEGAKQQLYLAVRLAIARTLLGGEHLPLLLDDALVDFDDRRFAAALTMLEELAHGGQQVILFTCHQRYQQVAVDYHVLHLTGAI